MHGHQVLHRDRVPTARLRDDAIENCMAHFRVVDRPVTVLRLDPQLGSDGAELMIGEVPLGGGQLARVQAPQGNRAESHQCQLNGKKADVEGHVVPDNPRTVQQFTNLPRDIGERPPAGDVGIGGCPTKKAYDQSTNRIQPSPDLIPGPRSLATLAPDRIARRSLPAIDRRL